MLEEIDIASELETPEFEAIPIAEHTGNASVVATVRGNMFEDPNHSDIAIREAEQIVAEYMSSSPSVAEIADSWIEF